MEATPFGQLLVVAVAEKLTELPTVSPSDGLLTTTFANAGTTIVARNTNKNKRIFNDLPQ